MRCLRPGTRYATVCGALPHKPSHGMRAVPGTRTTATLRHPAHMVHGTCGTGDWHPSVCGALHPCILAY